MRLPDKGQSPAYDSYDLQISFPNGEAILTSYPFPASKLTPYESATNIRKNFNPARNIRPVPTSRHGSDA